MQYMPFSSNREKRKSYRGANFTTYTVLVFTVLLTKLCIFSEELAKYLRDADLSCLCVAEILQVLDGLPEVEWGTRLLHQHEPLEELKVGLRRQNLYKRPAQNIGVRNIQMVCTVLVLIKLTKLRLRCVCVAVPVN